MSLLSESNAFPYPSELHASVFYAPNTNSSFVGNAASGGWSGFYFPSLPVPIKQHQYLANFTSPMNKPLGRFAGNTAHSTAFWWTKAGGISFGGYLAHNPTNNALQYSAGYVGRWRDTCRTEPLLFNNSCPAWAQAQMLIEDSKVFLSNNLGLLHFGARSEVSRFEAHDTSLGVLLYGQTSLHDSVLGCRSRNPVTFFAGCATALAAGATNRVSQTFNCNQRDYNFHWAGTAYQMGSLENDVHILVNVTMQNCDWSTWGPCLYSCSGGEVMLIPSASSRFAPGLSLVSKQITLTNIDYSTVYGFSTGQPSVQPSVTARLANWKDLDGTASFWSLPSLIGSKRAGPGWWNLDPRVCLTGNKEMWTCPLNPGDSTAAFTLLGASTMERLIATGTICKDNDDGSDWCRQPQNRIGTVTHFGRDENATALNLTANAKVVGPIIQKAGGWFVRLVETVRVNENVSYTLGMPKNLTIARLQVDAADPLIVAFPYPRGSQFRITGNAAPSCDPNNFRCTHTFSPAGGVLSLRLSSDPAYVFDNDAQVLYVRLVQRNDSHFGALASTSSPVFQPLDKYTRAGVSMPVPNAYTVSIVATCVSAPANDSNCMDLPSVNAPAALDAIPPCLARPDWMLVCFPQRAQVEQVAITLGSVLVVFLFWRRTWLLLPIKWFVADFRSVFRSKLMSNSVASVPSARVACIVFGAGLITAASYVIALEVIAAVMYVCLLLGIFRRPLNDHKLPEYAPSVVYLCLLSGCWVVFALTPFNALRVAVVLVGVGFCLCDAFESARAPWPERLCDAFPRALVEAPSVDAYVVVEVVEWSADKSEKKIQLALMDDVPALKPADSLAGQARTFALWGSLGAIGVVVGLYFALVVMSL